MTREVEIVKIIAKNTWIRSVRIKGLLPGSIVVRDLLLKDVTFHLIDRNKEKDLKKT
jgi:hypothetical protein